MSFDAMTGPFESGMEGSANGSVSAWARAQPLARIPMDPPGFVTSALPIHAWREEPFVDASHENFPDDENGKLLRRMRQNGDNLRKPRNIDFTVVLPHRMAAQTLCNEIIDRGLRVQMHESASVPALPWEVVVVRNMVPSHAGITTFERELDTLARPLGGRIDGWGCFEQA